MFTGDGAGVRAFFIIRVALFRLSYHYILLALFFYFFDFFQFVAGVA